MKLQVNTKRSWRDVVEFSLERWPEVEDAAASLARASGHLKFRVVHADGRAWYLTEHGVFRAIAGPVS